MTHALATLRLFNEKATKLRRLTLNRRMLDRDFQFGPILGPEPERLVRGFHFDGPDDEAIDAFVLTLRFFIQDNEPTSLRNMSRLYGSLPINPTLVARFEQERAAANALLDSSAFISIDGERLTCRRLVDTFVYGDRAHASPEKSENYRLWMSDDMVTKPYLLIAFCIAAMNFAGIVSRIRDINDEAITQLCYVTSAVKT
jgi:hypothetical protein